MGSKESTIAENPDGMKTEVTLHEYNQMKEDLMSLAEFFSGPNNRAKIALVLRDFLPPEPPKRPSTCSHIHYSVVEKGEENCSDLIEAHKACMRSMGFNI